jgi:hypothetical protein
MKFAILKKCIFYFEAEERREIKNTIFKRKGDQFSITLIKSKAQHFAIFKFDISERGVLQLRHAQVTSFECAIN